MNENLKRLENESIYIIREAYKTFPKMAMLWSMGKDSTVMMWLVRKAFLGRVPFPLIHIDTKYKIPAMIEFRDRVAKELNLDLKIFTNDLALKNGMGPHLPKLECCTALKTNALKDSLDKFPVDGLLVAIRRDEEGSRAKERFFSPRNETFTWDRENQPPELWNQYHVDFPVNTHVRIHPILSWSELNIWEYIEAENIPVLDLYFANENNQRYRSVGCAPCTHPINSTAKSVKDIIEELKNTKTSERAGRAQDAADRYAMEKLRAKGYM
jgi:sulfate adenylyltransferase subunit 2